MTLCVFNVIDVEIVHKLYKANMLAHFVVFGTPVFKVGARAFVIFFVGIIGDLIHIIIGSEDAVLHYV
jgi:hypothetical protein